VYILLAIASVAFLIVVHEGGHYFVARWCQMRIERFSVGFGPGILKKKSKTTGTTFQLAPIPFGGFVEIRGMNIAEEVDPDDKHAYPNRPAWQRFVTIFAGPATNYLSAIVLMMLVYSFHGVDEPRWYGVDGTLEGFDAHGKLEAGDRILAVDHVPLVFGEGATLNERINEAKGAPVTVTIERRGQRSDIVLKPLPNPDKKGGVLIGVKPQVQNQIRDVGVVEAAGMALRYPIEETKKIGAMLYGIVFGSEKMDAGGPIRMVEEFRNAFSAGLVHGIYLLAGLSVYLGLFNLLPIPALDGGRLVFLGYELITRRRANPKIEAMVHMAGIMALGVLMILVLIVDVRHLF